MNGVYLNAGQVCMDVKRIIIDESIAEEFTKILSQTKKNQNGQSNG